MIAVILFKLLLLLLFDYHQNIISSSIKKNYIIFKCNLVEVYSWTLESFFSSYEIGTR